MGNAKFLHLSQTSIIIMLVTYLYVFIHRSIIRTSPIERGISHEKSQIKVCNQVNKLQINKISKNMINYKEKIIYTQQIRQLYALQHNKTS